MARLEENFTLLEGLISQLEHEDITLEESFELYEKGMKLLMECNKELDVVEKKLIEIQNEE